MKNSVIILVLLICCNTTTAQFLNKDAIWNVRSETFAEIPVERFDEIQILKDSIINDTYYSLFDFRQTLSALREDRNKVFHKVLKHNQSEEVFDTLEHVLYDFNLYVGDSILLELPSYSQFYKNMWVVREVDSILIGNKPKKRILLEIPDSYGPGNVQYWIEDIGSSFGPLYFTGISEHEWEIELFCYRINETNIYGKCLTVDAGKDTTFCTGQNINTMILGTTAKIMNGKSPFKFAWECTYRLTDKLIFTASDFLNDTTLQSPTFKDITVDQDWLKFTLTVTDSENNIARDSLFVRFSSFSYLTGGGQPWFYVEKGDSILLTFPNSGIGGGIEPLTHYWQPKTYLSDPGSIITWCKPDSSIQYEAFAIDSCGCVSAIPTVYDIRVLPKNPSHDYQTVYSNRVALFENSDNQIKALRIDSVKVDTDSVFYPFTTIQEVSKNCFLPHKASWIGEKAVIKPNGTNLFFNREGDTITLKTQAYVHETWIAFQQGDDFRVKAKVQSIELENFMGLTDTVKTISLTAIDQNGNTLRHALNKLMIKISKTYGFVKTLNFYLFPDITVHYTDERLENYSLIGLTDPMVGFQNITWFEVNNFQVGDELHILEESSSWGGWDGEYGYSITNKANYKYIERIDYADSIVYRYSRKQSIETVTQDTTTLEIYVDTLKSVIIADPLFDKLPGEPIIDEINLMIYNFHMKSGTILSKTKPVEGFYNRNDSCWGIIMYDGCLKNNTYFKGLGGPYYACTNCCSLGGEERKLVYYKKGGTEWGEKLVITGISETKSSNDLKVFPNPAHSYFTISNPTNIQIKKIELFDFSGMLVQMWNATECAGNKLGIQHLPRGIYLLKAETEKWIKTEKLVIQ
jgi:hypothetical protein